MKKGLLIVYSGPSGVGKGSILNELMPKKELKLVYSVSMTTRKPRPNELEGVNYFFVSQEQFTQAIKNDEFLEYANFVGNYYGTPRNYVEEMRNKGFNVVLEIEVEGAKQVLSKCHDALSIFVMPPSFNELELRIRNRCTEDEETINQRLYKAKIEMEETSIYDYVIYNNDIKLACQEISEIVLKEMHKADK